MKAPAERETMKVIARPGEQSNPRPEPRGMAGMMINTRFLGQDITGQEKGLHEFTLEEVAKDHVKLKETSSRGSKASKWYDRSQWSVVEVISEPSLDEAKKEAAAVDPSTPKVTG